MILSFPIGAYVVFNSNIGNDINFQYPLDGLNFFIAGIGYKLPFSFEIGDCFILIWSIFLLLFTISILGPIKNFIKTLSHIMPEGWKDTRENDIVNVITWFSILVLISVCIDFIQGGFGVRIESPTPQNSLINFFQLSLSPLTEELGFRVALIGIPLFLFYSYRLSIQTFIKSLWRPSVYLDISNNRKTLGLIVAVSIFFGAAHIISGNPWSIGKFSQAAVAGMIIGWAYVRYGLAPAILIHWSTNYFIFSYSYLIADLNQMQISNDFSNPFSNMLEILLLITGTVSLAVKILHYVQSRKRTVTQT